MTTRTGSRALVTGLALLLLAPSLALAVGVEALFDLSSPAGGPFPSDRFTVVDHGHKTGVRVDLPKPDCVVRPSDCADIDVINTLDGFNPQPRLAIPFSGPIDLATVTSETVFLVRLGRHHDDDDHHHGGHHGRDVVGINQVVWEPTTTTLYAESEELLEQHTQYALVVTTGVRDLDGLPVEGRAFRDFRRDANFGHSHDARLKAYRKALLDALRAVDVHESSVVALSVFSTQSTTAVLEKIRKQIKAAVPATAGFLLAGGSVPTVFPVSTVTGVVWNQQRSTGPPLTPVTVLAAAALNIIPGVGTVAFGRFASPDYETPEKFIPPIGTRTGVPVVQGINTLDFNLFLPAGTPPAGGWPVAIYGHGFGDSKNNTPFVVAEVMAQQGIATIAIDVVGHGRGPDSTLTILRTAANGGPITFPTGGRGIDQNGNGLIDSTEGSGAAPPQAIISSRDGLRQRVTRRSRTPRRRPSSARATSPTGRRTTGTTSRSRPTRPIPKNPHTFLTGVLSPVAGGIALHGQLQIAAFFASEAFPGMTPTVIDPDPSAIPDSAAPGGPPLLVNVFEVPIVPPLPEDLNFIP